MHSEGYKVSDIYVMWDIFGHYLFHAPVAGWNPAGEQTCSWCVKPFYILQQCVFLRLACPIARVRALQKM